jgi:hypothetical protein
MALLAGPSLHVVRESVDGRWSDCAVIAAQRRRTGQVWVVLCGLSGPATYGAARALKSIAAALPRGDMSSHSPVLWAVVEVGLERTQVQGDNRRVVSQRVTQGPAAWPAEGS